MKKADIIINVVSVIASLTFVCFGAFEPATFILVTDLYANNVLKNMIK